MTVDFPGLGTAINVVTVVVGALLGMAVGHRLPGHTRSVVTDVLGAESEALLLEFFATHRGPQTD